MSECPTLQRVSAFPNGALQSADVLLGFGAESDVVGFVLVPGAVAGNFALGVGAVAENFALGVGAVAVSPDAASDLLNGVTAKEDRRPAAASGLGVVGEQQSD